MTDSLKSTLTDKDGNALMLGKRPLEGLTLTEPRPLKFPIGKTTRNYRGARIMPRSLEPGTHQRYG